MNMLFQLGGTKNKKWRTFMQKKFPTFYEFFQRISDQPAFKRAFDVVYGRPNEMGAMSLPFDPDADPNDLLRRLEASQGPENFPEGMDIPEGEQQENVQQVVTREMKRQLRKLGYKAAQYNNMDYDTVQDVIARKVRYDPTPNSVNAEPTSAANQSVNQPNVSPGNGRSAPAGTPAPVPASLNRPRPPAPGGSQSQASQPEAQSQANQAEARSQGPTGRPTYPDWLAPSQILEGKNYWRNLSPEDRLSVAAEEELALQAGARNLSSDEFDEWQGSGRLQLTMDYAQGHYKNLEYRQQPDGSVVGTYSNMIQRPGLSEARAAHASDVYALSDLGRQNTNLSQVARITNSTALGSPTSILSQGNRGSLVGVEFANFSQESVEQGINIVRNAWDTINAGSLPNDPKDVANSLKLRLNAAAKTHIDAIAKSLEEGNVPEQQVTEFKAKMTTMTGALVKNSIAAAMQEYNGEAPPNTWDRAVELKNAATLKEAMRTVPEIRDYIQERYGGSVGAALRGPATQITGGNGIAYAFGEGSWGINPSDNYGGAGAGVGGGNFRGPGSIFGGKLGSLLYGAYISKRFWSMTMAPELMEMEKYGQGMLVTEGVNAAGGGEGGEFTTSDSGWEMRKSRTQAYYSKAAYQMWGGFSDIGYSLTGDNGAWGRIKSGGMAGLAAISAGYAAATAGAFTLGMGGLAGAAGAASIAIAPIAMGVGATLLGGTLAMEAWNAMNPEKTPVTWGSLARGATAGWYQMMKDSGIELNDRQQALVDYEGPTEDFVKTEKTLGVVEEITGEKKETVAPTWRMLARGTGGAANETENARRVAQAMRDSGMTVAEFGSMFSQYATAQGYAPGTTGFNEALNQFTSPGLDRGWPPAAVVGKPAHRTVRRLDQRLLHRPWKRPTDRQGLQHRHPDPGPGRPDHDGSRWARGTGRREHPELQGRHWLHHTPSGNGQLKLPKGSGHPAPAWSPRWHRTSSRLVETPWMPSPRPRRPITCWVARRAENGRLPSIHS